MVRNIFTDPDTQVVGECYAVVYAPRRKRDRFPDNVVRVFDTEAQAHENADPGRGHHAARVIGPSRSSEGFMLYYLVRWLD